MGNWSSMAGRRGEGSCLSFALGRAKSLKRLLGLSLALICIGAPVPSFAQQVGQAPATVRQSGLAYALEHCAECHAVVRGQLASPVANAPPFETIAKTPGWSGRALAVWLQTPHPTMPNIIVPDAERDALIAYILRLRRPQWWKP